MQRFRCARCNKDGLPGGSKLLFSNKLGRKVRVCADCVKQMEEKNHAGLQVPSVQPAGEGNGVKD